MKLLGWWQQGPRLARALGTPGLIIGVLSLLSFGFSLVVLLDEYHTPTQTGMAALHQVFEGWVRADDYLGYTLIDRVERWQAATGPDRVQAARLLQRAVTDLGMTLTRDDVRFRLIRLDRIDLGSPGQSPLATWTNNLLTPEEFARSGSSLDRIDVGRDRGAGKPRVTMSLVYHVIPTVDLAIATVESSYRRLVLALLGLSGYSLLCLGYMARHAQTQRERIAREAAAAATLDLADRTCHELGNVAFVVANERRNLAGHIDLMERFVAEDAAVLARAVQQAGISPEVASRLDQALRREYARRGIDPEFEIKGSTALARDVCRQIATCSDYIALTVRELDGHLKQANLPTAVEAVRLTEIIADALALLAPRIEAVAAEVDVIDEGLMPILVRGDRRHLIHAIVNLIKNALEASAGAPVQAPRIRVSVHVEGLIGFLIIQDHGPGIDSAHLRRIFDSGYSTKATGRGLGLAIVRESIAAQGGVIAVTSQVGRGTTVRIGLPLAPNLGETRADTGA